MKREIFKRGAGGKIKGKFGAIRQVRIAITSALIVACLLLAGLPAGQVAAAIRTDTFTSSGTFTVPAGVYEITVEAWAGGGGGGGRSTLGSGGAGGGGGGAYARATISVTPGANYTVAVGTGGTGGSTSNGNGGAGGDSYFGNGSQVLANGGSGGTGGAGGAGGAGGTTAASTGTVKYTGGNGAAGTSSSTYRSGGGGGGAGNQTAGGNATGTTGGTGGTYDGGDGADGRTSNGAGSAGSVLGGGGSGAYESGGTAVAGGAGARGEVRITYETGIFTASGTFTVPAGVYQITVEAWGGGGGGGGRASSSTGGAGGGGGGAYARATISVMPGQNYSVTVGTGGAGGAGASNGAGAAGGDSYFGNGSQVLAKGGSGGTGGTGGAGGAGGTAAASTGTAKFSGGNGAAGTSSSPYRSGGGGGGAGNQTAGGNASGTTGGTGGNYDGGDGADGRTTSGAGSAGSTLGGGGSGAYRSSGGPYNGGAGARGEVRITYNPIPDAPALYPEYDDVQIAFNNIRQNTTTPTFRVSATHTGNLNRFQIELNSAWDFTGTAYTQTFSGNYSSGTQYSLNASSLSPGLPTTNNATYYVRVRASADAGAHWSEWSTVNHPVWSFTYKSSGEIPDWFQTTDAQFGTGNLTDVLVSSDSVHLPPPVLVASVQTISITISAGNTYYSGDLPSPVDDDYTVLFCTSSHASTQDVPDDNRVDAYMTDTNTIRVERIGTTGSIDVVVTAVEFNSDSADVQSGTFSIGSGSTSGTASLSPSVTLANSFLVFYFTSTSTTDTHLGRSACISGHFSSTSELTFHRQASDGTIAGHWWVVTATGGSFTVQHPGPLLLDSGTSETISISSVDEDKSFILYSWESTSTDDDVGDAYISCDVTSDVLVTAARGSTSDTMPNIYVQVVTFSGNEAVQRGSMTFGAGDGIETDTLSPAVDTDVAMPWSGALGIMGAERNDCTSSSNSPVAYVALTIVSAGATIEGDKYAGSGPTVGPTSWEVVSWVVGAGASSGTIISPAIEFDWVVNATSWGQVQVGATTATNNSITVQVLNSTGSPLSGKNVTIQNGGTSGSINLTDVSPTGGNATLYLRATLTNSGGGTPYLNDWMVTWVTAGPEPSTITVTAPSAIAFDTLVWGDNTKSSATNGTVTVVFGSGSPAGWQVTAQDLTNGGYMKSSNATLANKLQISGNGTTWAYADVGITYTGTGAGNYTLPFWARQVINTNEVVGAYNITIVFTGEILY